jgi:hypothetical protein
MNEILWQGIKGKPAPSPVRAAFLKINEKEEKESFEWLWWAIPTLVNLL